MNAVDQNRRWTQMDADRVRFGIVAALVALLAPASGAAQDATGSVVLPEAAVPRTSPDGLTEIELLVNPLSMPGAPAAMTVFTALPGASVPEHVHETSAELLYIVEGGGRLLLDGVEHELVAGTAIYIPAGALHGYRNDTAAPMRAVQVYVGPGPEERFRAWPASAADVPGTPQ